MKSRTRRLRIALLTLAPVAVFLLGFGWLTYRQYQRVRLRGPLIAAVESRDAALVQSLLDRGADPNARERPDRKPAGLRGLFLSLLGRDPDARGYRGPTALMLAAKQGDVDSVKLLLEHGADVNARDEAGWTALMSVMSSRNEDKVGALLRAGADVNARDDIGRTPLMWAAEFKFRGGINLLLSHGADVHARTKKGYTVLAYARGHPGLVRLLDEHGAKE